MRVRTPKSFNTSPNPKPSQEKAEKQAAQSAGDEAAAMLESAEANILPMPGAIVEGAGVDQLQADYPSDPGVVGASSSELHDATQSSADALPEPTEPPITSEAEPGKAAVDAGEGVTFQSIADGYVPRGQQAEPAEPSKPAHVLMYERCLADATEQHLQAALYRQELQGQLKDAKDSEKAALDRVSKIIAGGPERYTEKPQPIPNTAGGDQGITSPGEGRLDTDTPPAANTTSSDAWRNAPLTELPLPKKGKGSLNRLLKDGIETMGQFEDRRVAVSEGKGEWPKYFGIEKLTLVEEAFLGWLAANRDVWQAPVKAEEQGSAANASAEDIAAHVLPVIEAIDPAEPAASEPANDTLQASPEQYPSQELWDSWTEKAQTKWIEARADILHEQILAGHDSANAELDGTAQALWDQGADARTEGDGLENCPHPPGLAMDLWIRGWLGAVQAEVDLDKQAPLQDEPEPEQDEPEPELATTAATSSNPSPSLFELDDLNDL